MVVTELILVTLPDQQDMSRRLARLPHAKNQDARDIIFDRILDHAGEQRNVSQIAGMIAGCFSAYVRTHPTGALTVELTGGNPHRIDGGPVFLYVDVLVDDEKAKADARRITDNGWVIGN